ncbi:MAG TPA: deaminase [Thermoanaerobaculia bacterium]|nr:deaminase [Thermoanaerobaculia bacterium]
MGEGSRSRFKPKNQQVEFIFALAGPVGTDFDFVAATLSDSLKTVSYSSEVLKLSRFLRDYELRDGLLTIDLSSTFEDKRIREHQRAGNALREALDDNAALAIRAIGAISETHVAAQEGGKPVYKEPRRHAYILNSLKRPEEVHQLRQVYGAGFFLIGVVSPRSARIQKLASGIAKSRGTANVDRWLKAATDLVDIDEGEDSEYGQKLSDTFPMADLFVAFGADAQKSREDVREQVKRFVRLIMGANDTTPTAAESAMFHAFGAAVRSGSLARQVGAALTNAAGDIVSVGCNDVPKAGGGIYREGEHYDHRDIRKERDSSQEHEEEIVKEVLDAFEKRGWLSGKPTVSEAIASLEKARVVNLLEFMRAIHAEMDALLTAQRNGVSALHATLFCTTFPCHECAKLIIGAGISRVVYIEPYPKSRVAQMYQTEIATEGFAALCNSCKAGSTSSDECSSCRSKDLIRFENGLCAHCGSLHRVEFQPFVGIGPRRYLKLFVMTSLEGLKFKRKNDSGHRLPWTPAQRSPMYPLSYLEKESLMYDAYRQAFEKLKKKEQR